MLKKLFGGIDLTWKKLIIFAVLAGVYTAIMAIIPALKYTSFSSIVATFEVWILFGILIIMNSKSNKDAAFKCFIFFLISQPLIYLIQVPFSYQGWNLFGYYKFWFIWTVLCIPMGYIGYYMKKDKWWGYLILFPIILLLAYQYSYYLPRFIFSFPKYILVCLFCIATLIIYPLYIFNNKKIRITGLIISIILILLVTINGILNPPVYNTVLFGDSEEHPLKEGYKAYLKDDKYGSVSVEYFDNLECYMLKAAFTHEGKTELIIESPTGEKNTYDISIKIDTYTINKKN